MGGVQCKYNSITHWGWFCLTSSLSPISHVLPHCSCSSLPHTLSSLSFPTTSAIDPAFRALWEAEFKDFSLMLVTVHFSLCHAASETQTFLTEHSSLGPAAFGLECFWMAPQLCHPYPVSCFFSSHTLCSRQFWLPYVPRINLPSSWLCLHSFFSMEYSFSSTN